MHHAQGPGFLVGWAPWGAWRGCLVTMWVDPSEIHVKSYQIMYEVRTSLSAFMLTVAMQEYRVLTLLVLGIILPWWVR